MVLHELTARRQERLNSYLQALLASGLTVLPYDRDVVQPAMSSTPAPRITPADRIFVSGRCS